MSVAEENLNLKQQFEKRGADRVEIYVKADTIVGEDARQLVTLHNISSTGGLIEAEQPLQMDQHISILVQEDQAVTATIIWASWPLYGCRFQNPLPASVLSALKLRNMMPVELDPTVTHDLPSELSQRLRQLREEKGFSLAALSRRAGISKPSIWAWETGKTIPRSRSLHALAGALGVTIGEILGQSQALDGRGASTTWGAGAAAGLDASNGPLSELDQTILDARRRIAQLTGVSDDKVKISIQF